MECAFEVNFNGSTYQRAEDGQLTTVNCCQHTRIFVNSPRLHYCITAIVIWLNMATWRIRSYYSGYILFENKHWNYAENCSALALSPSPFFNTILTLPRSTSTEIMSKSYEKNGNGANDGAKPDSPQFQFNDCLRQSTNMMQID